MSGTPIQKLTEDRLLRCWVELAHNLSLVGDVEAVGSDLLRRYAEPHRRYHSITDSHECLALLDTVVHMADDALAIEAAIWFHDAIYEGGADDNEERSAELASDTLTGLGAPVVLAETVSALVAATDHCAPPGEPDARLLCDIDLYPLAATTKQFDANTEALRAEADLTDVEFDRHRKAFMEKMLSREAIYYTDHFHRQLEPAARANMGRVLVDLANLDENGE